MTEVKGHACAMREPHDALEIVVGSRGLGAIRAAYDSVSHEVLP